ncbi:MAG TPA: hypothetical protein VFN48_07565 [Solirubrobacteraceae bacterium]|nr:hypothetical protein [Solirubrobacteraceae bacterium]
MWLGLFLIIIAVLAALATVVTAGAFTIVLAVVAVFAAVTALFFFSAARAAGLKEATRVDAGASEVVTRDGGAAETGPGRVPATPQELVDARRAAQ